MKKSLMVVLALLMVLVSVAPSLAAGGPPPKRGANDTFTLAGGITAIDGKTVTVRVMSGSTTVHSWVGKDVPVQTTESTRFLLLTSENTEPITLAELQVGQNVSVSGTISNEVLTALRITVGAELIHYR